MRSRLEEIAVEAYLPVDAGAARYLRGDVQ
ncbi:hypothetical protein HD597_001021 [Nonomuraea thailandensis]|uniref:Uncharacterized protein n=1 Tax=Nonomuraea thailandensis TaxID=1188745 RepID=A0A9X2GEP4_9ACTN|nr:hypothetical protein [Nonomuraea thailandensis]